MSISKKNYTSGIRLKPDNVAFEGKEGELKVDLASSTFKAYLNGASRDIITADQSQTLTNKTIAAGSNTISGIANANIASGAAIDASKIADGSVSSTEFQYLSGVTSDIQTQINDAVGDAADVQTNLDNHINDTTDAHDASAISNTPSGNLAATDVQGALNELQTDVDGRATSAALTAHTGASTGVHGVTGAVVGTTDTQTLTNKTLTAPAISSPTGLVKADVGLSNVDDTSDATKNAAAVTLTNKTITSPLITGADFRTPVRSDVKQDTFANLVTYASTASDGQLAFATDTKAMYQIVDNALVSVGSSAGGFDSFVNLDSSELLSTWSTGNNATFLGGGSLAGTFAKESSTPLNGSSSYKYTQATSINDYLASPVQSVPVRFRGNQATFLFSYKYDGLSTDIEPVVWDVTNSAKLNVTTNLLPAINSPAQLYKANITIPSTCTQLRVGFQVKATNSGKILQFDDVQLSADTTKYADPSTITEWQSYTPTFTAFGTVSTSDMRWRRSGSNIEIRGTFISGNPTGSEARCSLPNGYISSASIATLEFAGGTQGNGTAAAGRTIIPLMEPNVAYLTFSYADNSRDILSKVNGNAISSNGTTIGFYATVPIAGLSASNPQIITASESFSSDTASFVYAGSSQYTLSTLVDAPVGTFITWTYAINTDTKTQTNASAPTQTTSDMNVNGIRIFPRPFTAASTAASPSIVAIQIGKGFKATNLDVYKSTGKDTAGTLDALQVDATTLSGMEIKGYTESTGILVLDAGYNTNANTSHNFFFSDATAQNNGYIVINAAKSPALVGVPQVQPRIAYISDVKSSGTVGGSTTAATYNTRTLNTLVDDTGIVSALASNRFTLPAGTYDIEASAPAYIPNVHKVRLRNITDSTTDLIGQSSHCSGDVVTHSVVRGRIIINSSKEYELQHYTLQTTGGTSSLGVATSNGDNEVYAFVKIIKVK